MSVINQRTPFRVYASTTDLDEVYSSANETAVSWAISKSSCRIQLTNSDDIKRVGKWNFARRIGININGPEVIYHLPRKKWRWSLKQLGIKLPPKNINRFKCGLNTGMQNLKNTPETPGQASKFSSDDQIVVDYDDSYSQGVNHG